MTVKVGVSYITDTSCEARFQPKKDTVYEIGVGPAGSEVLLARISFGTMKITGLEPSTQYDVAARVVTKQGYGPWGKRTTFTTARRP